MKILLKKNLLNGSMLDFGCGCGEDVEILKQKGFNIVGYDKFNQEYIKEDLLNNTYDMITVNYVFNVIPNLKEHQETLELIKKLSKNIYITVRSDIKAIKDTWIYNGLNLGYWTSNNSFQRFYEKESVIAMFGEVEFIINNSNLIMFKIK